MWGGHRLQNHPLNPSQNSSKCANHPIIIRRGAAWSPWGGNVTSHIPNYNWERFSAPGPSLTIRSSANQCSCSWSYKLHTASCGPSGPMAPNGKCGGYPEAATFRITGGEVLQGAAPGLHQLCQAYTFGNHPAPVLWSWGHLTHGYRGKRLENEKIMVNPRPNGGPIWTN